MYLQNLHLASSPPKIGIENKNICICPMPSMLFNCLYSNNPVWYAVVYWVVGVGFHQQWRPVEFDCCIIFLDNINQ